MAYKIKKSNVTQLPIYKIKGKFYFRDKRLGEYRNVNNPSDVIKEKDVFYEDFEKPTFEDKEKTEEYFLGKNPRKHKDYKFYGGK